MEDETLYIEFGEILTLAKQDLMFKISKYPDWIKSGTMHPIHANRKLAITMAKVQLLEDVVARAPELTATREIRSHGF
jgi:hypothetical protein